MSRDVTEREGAPRKGLLTRRRLIGGALGLGALAVAGRVALPTLWRRGPARPLGASEDELAAFAEGLFADVDRSRLWDVHVHLVGVGTDGSGCTVHPEYTSVMHPWKRLQFELYLGATGVEGGDTEHLDRDYVEILAEAQRLANPEGRLVLLAFDRFVNPDGSEDPERSNFYTSNEYVLEVARRHPDAFVPGGSIHPYRVDAVDRLEAAAAGGIRAVKWLPNAMGIDPASPKCDPFYDRMAALGLPLISHAGTEMAVDAAELQALGNPLRLRRALDRGVKVVVAHCGSLGDGVDLDQPEGRREEVENFDLFMRLMGEKQYEQNLFADISAMTFINRAGRPLREILGATELHPRLVNGSDYPVIGVEPVLSTMWLQMRGYLTSEERRLCNALGEVNPLLLDYAIKRCVKDDQGRRFAPGVFETSWLFE